MNREERIATRVASVSWNEAQRNVRGILEILGYMRAEYEDNDRIDEACGEAIEKGAEFLRSLVKLNQSLR